MRSRSILTASIAVALLLSSASASACLTVPAPSNLITSIYGWRYHPVFKRWRLHRGSDFRAEMSTQLVAAQSGVVQVSASGSGGNEIRIIGDDGTVARYLHLTRASVEPGTRVSAGQPVAISGNTGHASAAPHLHFEVYRKDGGDVNPETMLCGGVSHKPGADSVDGFPIQACNPDGGQCSGGGGSLPPSAGTGGGGGGVVSPGGGSSTSMPSGPKVEQFDDLSTAEIFASEVTKRFANPDWYKEQAERTTLPLVTEYLHMKALEQYIEFHKSEVRGRIEALLAARLARQNKADITERLDRQRVTAAKSGGPRQ